MVMLTEMEIVTFVKEVLQDVAEQAASYQIGQNIIRHLDRALWVVEKCARWAVPPPLDQDRFPQQELVRPLPWVFFLAMLIALRVTRESISIINLIMGKPPLRSSDVVMYIQSKRRYLRTLKYQGNRMMRARSSAAAGGTPRPWSSRMQDLLNLTMCFRHTRNYDNNNTMEVSNNDEVIVVKGQRGNRDGSGGAPGEGELDRLLERMMLDLDADSEDDARFAINNEAEEIAQNEDSNTESQSQPDEPNGSQSEKTDKQELSTNDEEKVSHKSEPLDETESAQASGSPDNAEVKLEGRTSVRYDTKDEKLSQEESTPKSPDDNTLGSPKEESETMIQKEKRAVTYDKKSANGRIRNTANKKKGLNTDNQEKPTSN